MARPPHQAPHKATLLKRVRCTQTPAHPSSMHDRILPECCNRLVSGIRHRVSYRVAIFTPRFVLHDFPDSVLVVRWR